MPNKNYVDVQGVSGQCPLCQHPPIRHVLDGTGATCLVCAFEHEQALIAAINGHVVPIRRVCTLKFEFKLSQTEREQAEKADKNAYPQETVCINCDCDWRAHAGYLCPTGDSTFLPVLDKHLPFIHVN